MSATLAKYLEQDCSVILHSQTNSKQEELENESEECCFICLGHHNTADAPLLRPCRCPSMRAHRSCLARWQLQQAGKREESHCRFCSAQLPDWRAAFGELPKATPIMSVVHEGVTHQVEVQPGAEGREHFMKEIRRIFQLSESAEVALSFGCKVPGSGNEELSLEGWDAFDAAVHCAAISAGQRLHSQHGHTKPDGNRKRTHSNLLTKPAENSHSSTRGHGSNAVTSGLRRLFSRGNH